jgi:hypothetical protein
MAESHDLMAVAHRLLAVISCSWQIPQTHGKNLPFMANSGRLMADADKVMAEICEPMPKVESS